MTGATKLWFEVAAFAITITGGRGQHQRHLANASHIRQSQHRLTLPQKT